MDFNIAQTLRQPQAILFVTSQLRQRELKIAFALRSLSWKVGLLYYHSTPFSPEGYFDFIIAVESAKEAYNIAKKITPRLIHVFSGAIDDYVLFFCRDKIAPVVIDLNDIFSPALMDYCPERFTLTRQALELADGFCARDLQVKRAEKIDQLKIPEQIIFFPEYCWNKQAASNRIRHAQKEIHIVSVGTISLETYGMFDCCYLELVRLIIKNKIHFHIYPPSCYRKDYAGMNMNFTRDYADFLELAHHNPYLHLHDSLPPETLITEIAKYDFGIISGGYKGFGQKYTHFKRTYVEACYSGRITDYLEAGLPILINEEVSFDDWLLKRYQVAFDLKAIAKPGFKTYLQNILSNPELAEQIKFAKSTLSILKNAPRLAKFYSAVLKANPVSKKASLLLAYLKKIMPKKMDPYLLPPKGL